METILSDKVAGPIEDTAAASFKDFPFFLLDFPFYQSLITILFFPLLKFFKSKK